ncbi:MAG TPA: hypothetical protein VF584_20075 [Longimicrobium sp.]|jgi:hypothetical protein
MPGLAALAGNYSQAPAPFDPRYATAAAGDTLRFADRFSGQPGICHKLAESVPSPQAKVVAVSGRVAVDLRHPLAAAYLDPVKAGWLRDAAATPDRLLLPTMRSLFADDFQPSAGGGGRFYVLLGSHQFGTGFACDGPLPTVNVASQASCPRASEMVVSLHSAERFAMPQNQNVSYAAGMFLHEYAHNACQPPRPHGQHPERAGWPRSLMETISRIGSGRRATRDLAGARVDGAGGAHRPADPAALSGCPGGYRRRSVVELTEAGVARRLEKIIHQAGSYEEASDHTGSGGCAVCRRMRRRSVRRAGACRQHHPATRAIASRSREHRPAHGDLSRRERRRAHRPRGLLVHQRA